jgi:3-deoxy-D-manno-octulosonate 8-phosphate phosphatase (KDO 8-P phosphatase)
MPASPEELQARAQRVRLVLLDVDGVLTDGVVFVNTDGSEAKGFSIRDGAAIVWSRQLGLEVGLLSGRPSGATLRRAAELGVTLVSQTGPDKLEGYAQLKATGAIDDGEIAYMGDDILDLPVIDRVGLSASPADAVAEVRARVHWVAAARGGQGAVREFLEMVLRAQDKWDRFVRAFGH